MLIRRNEDLSAFTSIKIGGRADYFIQAKNVKDLKDSLLLSRDKDLPLFILGGGSNVICADIKGVVVNTRDLKGLKIKPTKEGILIEAMAGTYLRDLVLLSLKENLWGIHRLYGFPATVGGAVAMNAGAFGVEIKDFLQEITFLDWEGNILTLKANEVDFSYRESPFPKMGIVVSCLFLLKKSPYNVKDEFNRIRRKRKKTQPINKLTCGSTFKNPPGDFAGRLMERVKLKGYKIGRIGFSEIHANFLINYGGATFQEALILIKEAKKRVLEEFGIELQEEVKLIENSSFNGWKIL